MKEYIKRYLWLTVGLFIMAISVALSTKANLGTSPISCVPYVLSLAMPLTMGQITIIMHVVFILLQILLLRKDYELIQLLQLAVAFVFGYFTDLSLWIVRGINPTTYPEQVFICLLSCIILAIGVAIEVKADVVMLAGEGLISAISKVFHFEFGKTKVGFDCTLVAIGVVLSFVFLGKLEGIREGTIAAAVLVGMVVHFIDLHLSIIYTWAGIDKPLKECLETIKDNVE